MSATVERQDLWISGEGGYHTYRIPALIRTAAGSVLAFCEGRKHSRADAGEIDLLLRRSRDGGRTWEPTLLVATDPGMTCGNPAPVVDGASGTIWLPFCKNPAAGGESAIRAGAAERTVWLTRSADDGATWAEPVEISATVKRPDWSWYATGPGHGVRLRSGRLLVPCDHRTRRDGAAETLYAHMIYSDDHGATWRIGGLLDLEGGNECIAVETADGAVYFNARDQRKRGHRGVSWSTDGGLTFPPGRWDEALVEPACQGSAVDLPPGSVPDGGGAILFCNPASAEPRHADHAAQPGRGPHLVVRPRPGARARRLQRPVRRPRRGHPGCVFRRAGGALPLRAGGRVAVRAPDPGPHPARLAGLARGERSPTASGLPGVANAGGVDRPVKGGDLRGRGRAGVVRRAAAGQGVLRHAAGRPLERGGVDAVPGQGRHPQLRRQALDRVGGRFAVFPGAERRRDVPEACGAPGRVKRSTAGRRMAFARPWGTPKWAPSGRAMPCTRATELLLKASPAWSCAVIIPSRAAASVPSRQARGRQAPMVRIACRARVSVSGWARRET